MSERDDSGVRGGLITAAAAAEGRTTQVPVIFTRQRPPEPAPGAVTRYVTDRGRFHYVKIVTLRGETAADLRDKHPPGDSEDEALVRAALAHQRDGRIFFSDYSFGTPHRSVAAYLDTRIRQGLLQGVARDSEQLRLRCPVCDHTELNTALGREKLLRHTIETHPVDEDEDWSETMGHERQSDDYDPTQGDRPGSKASAVPTGDMHTPGDPADNDAAPDAFHELPAESRPFGPAEQAQVRSPEEVAAGAEDGGPTGVAGMTRHAPETGGGPPAPPERVERQVAEQGGPTGPTGAAGTTGATGATSFKSMKKDELVAELESAGLDPDKYANNEERVEALEKHQRSRR